MIKNIKIHNILIIIEISKSVEFNNCTHFEYAFVCVFYDLKSSMGLKKSRCDVPSSTTQRCVCPMLLQTKTNIITWNVHI